MNSIEKSLLRLYSKRFIYKIYAFFRKYCGINQDINGKTCDTNMVKHNRNHKMSHAVWF